jgi:hypothetical protein
MQVGLDFIDVALMMIGLSDFYDSCLCYYRWNIEVVEKCLKVTWMDYKLSLFYISNFDLVLHIGNFEVICVQRLLTCSIDSVSRSKGRYNENSQRLIIKFTLCISF